MFILLGGVAILVAFMALVMGSPIVIYLKRDEKWRAGDRSRDSWYGD